MNISKFDIRCWIPDRVKFPFTQIAAAAHPVPRIKQPQRVVNLIPILEILRNLHHARNTPHGMDLKHGNEKNLSVYLSLQNLRDTLPVWYRQLNTQRL